MREGIIVAEDEKDGREEEQVRDGCLARNFLTCSGSTRRVQRNSRAFHPQLRPFHSRPRPRHCLLRPQRVFPHTKWYADFFHIVIRPDVVFRRLPRSNRSKACFLSLTVSLFSASSQKQSVLPFHSFLSTRPADVELCCRKLPLAFSCLPLRPLGLFQRQL